MEKHPQLKEKLQLLYSLKLNPRITSNTDLAKEIGKSKQAISRWCIGSETTRGDTIPKDAITKVAAALFVEPAWLSLSYPEFEEKVNDRAGLNVVSSDPLDVEISVSTLPITNVDIFGREEELELLDKYWFDSRTNVVEVVAFGGAGKSSLINAWLSKLSKSNYKGAAKIYAWSFYWQSQFNDVKYSGDYFIEHALEWFGDENPTIGSSWSKATRLAKLIRDSKTLLILDGLEPLQHPAGRNFGQIDNPTVSLLIKELAAENSGLCLISTRYSVKDLSALRDGRVYSIQLSRVSNNAGTSLLKCSGIVGSKKELQEVVENYSGHALSLQLFAGYVRTVHDGILKNSKEKLPLIENEDYKNQVEKILSFSFKWLRSRPGLQLVKLLSIVERSSTLDELRCIVGGSNIESLTSQLAEMTEQQWRFTLRDLQLMRIISLNQIGDGLLVDCHPLIKDYVSQQLELNEPSLWIAGHKMMFEYLKTCFVDHPSSINQFEPYFRAVLHAASAGNHKEAFSIYYEKIKSRQFSMFAEGSHYADLSCLKTFFEREWDQPISSLPEDAQVFLLMSAATNSIYLGNIQGAIQPSVKSINWFVSKGEFLQAAVAAGPLLSMYIASGDLLAAESLLEDLRETVNSSGNEIAIAMYSTISAYVCYLKGEYKEAGIQFEEADQILVNSPKDTQPQFPTISSYYCKFLLDTDETMAALERSLKTFAWRNMNNWQVSIDTTSLYASDLLVLGLTFLKLKDYKNALLKLDKQVNLFRSSDEWFYLPTGLNSRARYYTAVKDFELALQDLRESIEVAQSTGAKFGEWEAHLDMANLYKEMNDLARCAQSLNLAKQMPGMQQYKFRDKEILELENSLAKH